MQIMSLPTMSVAESSTSSRLSFPQDHSRRDIERPSQIDGDTYSQLHDQGQAGQERKKSQLEISCPSSRRAQYNGVQALLIPIDDNSGLRQPPYGNSPPR